MEPSTILRSDALDILFENRNKQYGAYTLRREYPQRLLIAMGGMAVLVLAANFFLLQPPSPKLLSGPIILTDDHHFIPPPATPVDPPPPPAPAPPPPPAASEQYVAPEIVPDDQHTDPLPEMDDLVNKVISTISQDGPLSDNITRPPAPESSGTGAAPIEPEVEKTPEILKTADIMPSFPGGLSALQRWLSRNLKPQDGLEPGQRVKVIARFVVDVNGKITGIQLTQSGGDPYDQEVMRVIKKMPQWNPGIQNGNTVAVWFNIPIIFETPEE
ncbi:energy transducer TonB [Flavihumibacter sp. UBA7668]|uniref:energy transducer TonB n=1 Tax=Flavihumibacter sp. UBA7668 TaxID=1946542 RepID=UPI0025BEA909|nr:energy transducer TonB [Flavihumibacter sp. UBA7668]